MKSTSFPHLFEPIQIGTMVVQNRIAMAPTDISSAHADGSVSERSIIFHEQVAKGGTGFIIVGATTPDRATGRPTVTCFAADEDPLIPGLASLAEAMHRHGAKCAVQLQHPGRQSAWPRKDMISASDQVVDLPGSAGHEVIYAEVAKHGKSIREMSVEETYDLIDKFAEAAWRVQQAGFDAVELHGAHGYLIAQFMSPYVNKRNDRFGGSLINRLRFPLEIISRIKLKCGKDFPVGIRYSGEEWMEGSRELAESVKVAQYMQDAGCAFLDISAGIFDVPGPTMDPMYYSQGWNTYTAEEIKKHVKIPVITSHTLRDPAHCERIVAEGKADMVGLSRGLIADPYWANKAKAGKPEEIRKCISCLVGCWQESLMIKRECRCAINPAVGDERFIKIEKASTKCSVAVVGGGPAGLEAAHIAFLRGHSVTVFEKTGEIGGAVLNCCMINGKNKMKWYADWIRRQVKDLGIEVKYRTAPSAQDLKPFDAVILATGGKLARPEVPGINLPFVITYEDVLRCSVKNCEYYPADKPAPATCGETVLIWGDHFGAADAAEDLGTDGKKVIIVTEAKEFATWLEPIHKDVMMKRFKGGNGEGLTTKKIAQPVTVLTQTTVVEIRANGEVVLQDSEFRKTVLKVDNVVLAKFAQDNELYDALIAQGTTVQKVGDAKAVRNLRAAVMEGSNAALVIENDLGLNANNAFISEIPTLVNV
jgi:2,4-dienoyl-CoA reductase-like NADH-dependent reductase (Old Yellow Enzyme family)/thioredoxin reductase